MLSGLKCLARRGLSAMGLKRSARWPFVERMPHPPIPPQRALDALAPELKAPVEWIPDDQAPLENELYQLWRSIPEGHKWRHYFDAYLSVLAPLRNRPIRFLEIGIYRGASLALWRKYLHPDSVIVGIDLDAACQRFEDGSQHIYCRIGNQADKAFLQQVVAEFGPFDVILDDGSHQCSHMIASFNHLFLAGLKPEGVYIVEDVHANYWMSHRDQSYSFMDFAKDLADVMHQHYVGARGEMEFRIGGADRPSQRTVPRLTRELREIRFLDSLILFYRQQRSLPTSEHL